MKLTLIAAVAAVLAVQTAAPEFAEELKHATDPDAQSITSTKSTSISELTSWPRPANIKDDGTRSEDRRFGDAESTIWSFSGSIQEVEIRDDGDLRMVLTDKAGHKLVAECPDPEESEGSMFSEKIEAAREAALELTHEGRTAKNLHVPVRIHGIGYFGRLPKDAAKTKANGYRLMPILSIVSDK
jgi:hypothetical protein